MVQNMDDASQFGQMWHYGFRQLTPARASLHHRWITQLEECISTILLGVTLTSDLQWTSHIETVTSKAFKFIRHLHSALLSPDPQTVKQLYTTLIRPIIEYASVVCPPATKSNLALLERVQRKALKWGKLCSRRYPDRLAILGLQTIEERRKRGDCIQMFKHFSQTQPIAWTNPLAHPERDTRGHIRKYRAEAATYHTPLSRFDFLPNRIAAWWNQLPDPVVNAVSVNAFKNAYDTVYVTPQT